MVTERVVYVAIAWLETIYTRYRMFQLPPEIINSIVDLDFDVCISLISECNLADLHLLAIIMTTVPWDEIPDSFVEEGQERPY